MPVISTGVGAEGLFVENGVTGLTADTAEGLASLCISILNNIERRKKLVIDGFKFGSEHYDWKIVCSKLDQFFVTTPR